MGKVELFKGLMRKDRKGFFDDNPHLYRSMKIALGLWAFVSIVLLIIF